MHAAGSIVAGRYRLDRVVAERPGAAVWRGVDVVLDRPVRVRLVARSFPQADLVLAAARSRALVDDHRAGHVLDADLDDEHDVVLVVTSWPAGEPLSATLLADGPLDPADATAVVHEAAEVLALAHDRGLAHLALGPDSLVLGPEGEVTVLGLAVDAALHGVDGRVDDAAERARLDARGLGALLYACLTARWPRSSAGAGSADGLPDAPLAGGRLCTPRQVRAAVPGDVDLLCRRALGEAVSHGALDSPHDLVAALTGLRDQQGRGRWPVSWFRRRGPVPPTGRATGDRP